MFCVCKVFCWFMVKVNLSISVLHNFSLFKYAYLDFGTNYCILRNLIDALGYDFNDRCFLKLMADEFINRWSEDDGDSNDGVCTQYSTWLNKILENKIYNIFHLMEKFYIPRNPFLCVYYIIQIRHLNLYLSNVYAFCLRY